VTYTRQMNYLYMLPVIRNFKCIIMDNNINRNNFHHFKPSALKPDSVQPYI